MAKVLIVEDEAALLILAESVLQHAGHETISAASLAEAQSIIESDQSFDLVFTDLTLVEETDAGIEIGLMATRARPNVPILYTTGRTLTDGMKSQFVENSAFLPKPYTDDEMLGAVDELLKRTRD